MYKHNLKYEIALARFYNGTKLFSLQYPCHFQGHLLVQSVDTDNFDIYFIIYTFLWNVFLIRSNIYSL